MIALLTAVGWAAAAGPIGAVVEPVDVVEQYRLHAAEKGITGPAAELVCRAAAEAVQVCATVLTANGWRYATHADGEVVAPSTALEPSRSAGFERKQVPDIGHYWVRQQDDGREGLVMVTPEILTSLAPVPVVVAWPVPGLVVAWVPGNPSLDRVLSVGVAKMAEESNHPISTKVYRYANEEWSVWGEAKPSAAQ